MLRIKKIFRAVLLILIPKCVSKKVTVFGVYLKLEESSWVRIRRKKKKEKLEKILTSDWIKSHSKDDLTEVTLIPYFVEKLFINIFSEHV